MSWIAIEGFEVYGDTSTADADVETAINKRPLLEYETGASDPGPPSLIDDFEATGYALRMPATLSGEESRVEFEFPASFQQTTNGSVPVYLIAARIFVPDDAAEASKVLWRFKSADAGGNLIILSVAGNGTDLTWDDSSTTATISGAVTPGEWNYIEAEFKPTSSGNGGYAKVWVDDSSVYDSGARNIAATFFSTWGIEFVAQQLLSGTGDEWIGFDDIALYTIDGATHTERLGPMRIARLAPTSDGGPNDWSPSTGTDNFAVIDEVELDTADYVEATTDGDDDHYGLESMPSATAVHCVQLDVECIATSGTPTLHFGFDDGSADEDSEGPIGTGSNTVARGQFGQDPSGSDWTESSVNTVEATIRFQS